MHGDDIEVSSSAMRRRKIFLGCNVHELIELTIIGFKMDPITRFVLNIFPNNFITICMKNIF